MSDENKAGVKKEDSVTLNLKSFSVEAPGPALHPPPSMGLRAV